MIIFDSNRDEARRDAPEDAQNYDIYTMSRRTGELRRITSSPGWDMYGAFSPDGDRIVWRRALGGTAPEQRNFEIFVRDLRSGDEANISNHPGTDTNPHWSPIAGGIGGDWIAFVSTRDGAANIHVVRPDGTAQRRLTTGLAGVLGYSRPTFSPDGTRILANRTVAGVTDVVSIHLEP